MFKTEEYCNDRREILHDSKPSYLNNLISVQPHRSTRSSSVVTLSRPPTISSLKSQIAYSG